MSPMTEADEQALRELCLDLMRDGQPIEAVKLIRSQTGDGIRSAALKVRALAHDEGIELPNLTTFGFGE